MPQTYGDPKRRWLPMKVILVSHQQTGKQVRAYRGYSEHVLTAVTTALHNAGIEFTCVDDSPPKSTDMPDLAPPEPDQPSLEPVG